MLFSNKKHRLLKWDWKSTQVNILDQLWITKNINSIWRWIENLLVFAPLTLLAVQLLFLIFEIAAELGTLPADVSRPSNFWFTEVWFKVENFPLFTIFMSWCISMQVAVNSHSPFWPFRKKTQNKTFHDFHFSDGTNPRHFHLNVNLVNVLNLSELGTRFDGLPISKTKQKLDLLDCWWYHLRTSRALSFFLGSMTLKWNERWVKNV